MKYVIIIDMHAKAKIRIKKVLFIVESIKGGAFRKTGYENVTNDRGVNTLKNTNIRVRMICDFMLRSVSLSNFSSAIIIKYRKASSR